MNEIVFVSGYEDRREQDQQVEGGGHLFIVSRVRPLMVSKDPQIVIFLFQFWLLYPDST